jgi:hypothetical protein
MKKQQKKPLSPEAAKILEQYRNAGKPQPVPGDGAPAPAPGENGAVPPPRQAAPPPPATRQRSGVRGK